MRCDACLTRHGNHGPCPAFDRVNVISGKVHITRWRGRWTAFFKTTWGDESSNERIKAAADHASRLNALGTV